MSPETDSAALRCIPQYYQTPKYQLSGSPYHRELTWNFLPKIILILARKCSIWRSLCEKISQTCGEPSSCYCSCCFYAIVLPTGKIIVLTPRMMENHPQTFSKKMVKKLLCAVSAARFLKMYGTCSELRSCYNGVCLYAQLVPKTRGSSFLWDCIMDDEHHKKGKNTKQISLETGQNRSKWTSSCENISQTRGDSRSCYLRVCFYPTVLPKWKITAL